jgi:NAD(P)-dependent dehydrogenase (short-subunit alcohol dehydrogenase family)
MEAAAPSSSPGSALAIGASRCLVLGFVHEYLKQGWIVVGTVRGAAALYDLAIAPAVC